MCPEIVLWEGIERSRRFTWAAFTVSMLPRRVYTKRGITLFCTSARQQLCRKTLNTNAIACTCSAPSMPPDIHPFPDFVDQCHGHRYKVVRHLPPFNHDQSHFYHHGQVHLFIRILNPCLCIRSRLCRSYCGFDISHLQRRKTSEPACSSPAMALNKRATVSPPSPSPSAIW